MITIKRLTDEQVKIYVEISDTITLTKILNDKELKQLYSDLGSVISRKMIPVQE
jgi:hypothetical protein